MVARGGGGINALDGRCCGAEQLLGAMMMMTTMQWK
jgi:hypothetical protein